MLTLLRRAAAVVLLGACLLRWSHWGAPVTGDEAYTLRNYAGSDVAKIRSTYNAPNNHILLSLLLRGIDRLSGKALVGSMADPRPLQVPSLLAATGAVVLLHACAGLLAGPAAALLASAAFATAYWHLLYGHMLRGYSLACFWNLLALWLLLQWLLRRRRWALAALPPVLAAGHYTLATNVLYSAALVLWGAWSIGRIRAAGASPKKRRKPASGSSPPTLLELAAAVVVAGILSAWAYAPAWKQLREASLAASIPMGMALSAAGDRIFEALKVCGNSALSSCLFAGAAMAGLAAACSRRGRGGRAAALCAAMLFVPPALSVAAGMPVLPSRVYTAALPFWALSLALGMRAAAGWIRLRLRWRRRALGHACLAGAGILLAFGAPQAGAYWAWNRGVDPRRVLLEIISRASREDDFAVAYAFPEKEEPRLDWDYYGFAGHIEPHLHLHRASLPAHVSPGRIFILAEDLEGAARAAARSGLDPWLRAALKDTGGIGRARIYEALADESVLAAYRKAAGNGSTEEKAQGLTGLGAQALRRGDFERAAGLLERAKSLRPDTPRIRYQLGLARYLQFDDERAGVEFRWCADADPGNAHAVLFRADTLAGQGRSEEARSWYRRFEDPGRPSGYWLLEERARAGADALEKRWGHAPRRFSSLEDLDRAARVFLFRGSYERAQALFARAEATESTSERRAGLAISLARQYRYAAAARECERFLRENPGAHDIHLFLARELMHKSRFDEARAHLGIFSERNPGSDQAARTRTELARATGIRGG